MRIMFPIDIFAVMPNVILLIILSLVLVFILDLILAFLLFFCNGHIFGQANSLSYGHVYVAVYVSWLQTLNPIVGKKLFTVIW